MQERKKESKGEEEEARVMITESVRSNEFVAPLFIAYLVDLY